MRAFTIALGVAAALGACGGRAQILGSDESDAGCEPDCERPPPNAGLPSRGGAGGAGPVPVDAGTTNDAGAAEAGVGGDLANGGAPDGYQGGAGNPGPGGNVGGTGVGGGCSSNQKAFATEVLSHSFGGGQNFNQTNGFPTVLLGPPVANDPNAVVSLGNGGWVVLGFTSAIVDGPGVDFTVFENPLPTFKELATVAVSDDAEHWTEFPCTAAQEATDFGFCAGVGVVHSSPNNGIDPLDPAVSGGDHYDLADLGLTQARFVRITDRFDLTGSAGVFDLDAVAIVHAECQTSPIRDGRP